MEENIGREGGDEAERGITSWTYYTTVLVIIYIHPLHWESFQTVHNHKVYAGFHLARLGQLQLEGFISYLRIPEIICRDDRSFCAPSEQTCHVEAGDT